MTLQLVSLLYTVVRLSFAVWLTMSMCWVYFSSDLRARLNPFWVVLKWIAVLDPPMVLIDGTLRHSFTGWTALFIVIDGLFWWRYRNVGDDDTWKNLKKKVTEKIEAIRGRLVIVPAGGTA